MSDGTKPPEELDTHGLLEMFSARRFDVLADSLLEFLTHFERIHYFRLTERDRRHVDALVASFLYFLAQPDMVLSENTVDRFLELHPVIADLVAMSSFRNTDAYVRIVMRQPDSLAKLLILYSAYNTVRLDRDALFAANPRLASQWYLKFLRKFNTGCVDRNSFEHLREHVAHVDDRLCLTNPEASADAYFGSTYIDNERDRLLKAKINDLIRRAPFMPGEVRNRPDPKSIGVFSSFWSPGHATYRSILPFIKSLKPDYRLTLIKLGQPRKDHGTDLFDAVGHCRLAGGRLDGVATFDPNDFLVAIFTDIGMTAESIVLSNMQIAPIQVAIHGHPVSTFGSKIGYWISGTETEVVEESHRHYSERLVLVPGAGLLPTHLEYVPRHPELPASPIVINCPWAAQKVNYPQIARLQGIIESAGRPVRFRFFPGHAVQTGMISFCRSLAQALGPEHVEVHRNVSYTEYAGLLEAAHFAIDSIPFGGYNTVVDTLFLGIPMVAYCGDRFYNRDAAFLLRRVGMDELVAGTVDEYVDKIRRLIQDDDYREELRSRLRRTDIMRLIFGHEEAAYFRKAIDHLIANREDLVATDRRSPIVVGR